MGAFLTVLAGIAAVLAAASTTIGPVGLLTLAAVLASGAIAAAPSLAPMWRNASGTSGVVAAGPGLVLALVEVAVCELGPLAWLGHAWEGSTRSRALRIIVGPHTTADHVIGWCAVGIIVAVAGGILLASAPGRGARLASAWRLASIGLALAAIVVAPIVAGATALVVLAVAAGVVAFAPLGAAITTRRDARVGLLSGALVFIPAVPLAGWAALTRGASVTVLAIAVGTAVMASTVGRDRLLRVAHAGAGALATIVLAPVAALAAGSSRPVAAFVGTLVAGGLLLVGTFLRPDTIDGLVVETAGAAGIAATVLLAMPSRPWIAASLTAIVPVLLGASARRGRTVVYGVAASAVALAATWMWLAAAGVTVVEAYTLPAAARVRGRHLCARACARVVVAQSGLRHRAPPRAHGRPRDRAARRRPRDLVGDRGTRDRARRRAASVAGAARARRGRAVRVGLDKLGPPAARLPRWTMLAVAGALLLWVGTTFERRRDEMSRVARRLAGLR